MLLYRIINDGRKVLVEFSVLEDCGNDLRRFGEEDGFDACQALLSNASILND